MPVRRRPGRRRRSPASRSSGGSSAGRWLILAVAGVVLFLAGLYLGTGMTRVDGDDGADSADQVPGLQPEEALGPPESGARPTGPDRAAARDTPPLPVPTEPEIPAPVSDLPAVDGPPPPGDGAAVALVIDDLGRSIEDVTRLAGLDVPITYALLPFESRTAEVASELRRLGVEWILHLPMEPSTGADPGPGALRRSMSPGELAGATRAALDAVPGAVGVNNHMGSSLSADRPSMDAVLREIGRRGLYFLDSRTSAESVGYRAARDLEIPAAERQVFLDPDPRAEAVRYQFRRLLAVARERGAAIAIGHPHAETLRVLEEEIPLARERGYRFVPVSYLLDSTAVAAR